MCGIAGFYPRLEKEASISVLKRMLTRIKHRGPDQSGIYLNKAVGIGSVRLSIIDVASGGMPLSNQDDSLWIVFNGEIFNYVELRRELQRKGHVFKTNSDTEVILHLYEEYGSGFLQKLNGQFAIAIWDEKKNELFIARDRVGIRPIFYTRINGFFVFGSEIKALSEFPGVEFKICPESLSQVFTLWTTISPKTAFENIFEVPPGHFLTVNSKGILATCYWELPLIPSEGIDKRSVSSIIPEFRDLLTDAVRIRLRADVPVGAYLSGGIDSSVITSLIRDISPDNLRTFSIGFADKEFDETAYQSIAVNYLKTDHTYMKCCSNEIANTFSDVVWHSEIPLLRTAPCPMYLLSKVVNGNKFKVVLTGEGADELLGGYDIFKETIIREFWSRQPASKLRPLLLKKLYSYLPQMDNANMTALKMFYGYKLNETASPVYSHLLRWNNTSRIKNYFSEDLKQAISSYDPIREMEDKVRVKFQDIKLLKRAQWLEVNLFMSGYLLSSQGDRMAMANSVEGRYPFLDYRVIEFCMKLSSEHKLQGLNEKVLLKKMMSGKLPEPIINRTKQPYRAPVLESFFSNKAPSYVHEMLSREQVNSAGIFEPDSVSRLLGKICSGKTVSEIDNMAITGILSTQILHSLFTKKSKGSLLESDLVDFDICVIRDN
ncbi:asparagine synthase (glutamine-hydrolyzing) [Flavihumibacter sp. R14]|nr:asparagine synthase (glutamine-hydrolyzing) [Flavihumibacter soli]